MSKGRTQEEEEGRGGDGGARKEGTKGGKEEGKKDGRGEERRAETELLWNTSSKGSTGVAAVPSGHSTVGSVPGQVPRAKDSKALK